KFGEKSMSVRYKINGQDVTHDEFRRDRSDPEEESLFEAACETYPGVLSLYRECRGNGMGHRAAVMHALGEPPMTNTDREFLHGHCNGNQFEKKEHIGDYYKSVADAHGVDVKGAVYLSGLAEFPGDPKAWVRGRGDVQKVCEERGWNCNGMVEVKGQQRE